MHTFRLLQCTTVSLYLVSVGLAASPEQTLLPKTCSIGNSRETSRVVACSSQITLSQDQIFLLLDFAEETAGTPFFDVKSLSGPTQVEVKYAEQLDALDEDQSDGPWTFNSGLSNTFRIETFNFTDTGLTTAFFVQGGQRWESLRLLTNTTVTFKSVGFDRSSESGKVERATAKFNASTAVYEKIFDLGAVTCQAACIESAPSTWTITSDGAYIRGQTPAVSALGVGFSNYTLSFRTKISRGGTGWKIASGRRPFGAYLVLNSNYPKESTFLNINETLLPANTLVFNYGWSLLNQSTLETGWNEYYPVDVPIHEDTWYEISTSITPAGYNVSLDGLPIAFVPILQAKLLGSSSSPSKSGSAYSGTFGFGAFQDQAAYIKDVQVKTQNGAVLYYNSMLSDSVLAEYSVAPLETPVCLDGAKRDRLLWIGDFYHTVRVVSASTLRWDYILSSMDFVFRRQRMTAPLAGFVPINAAVGGRPEYEAIGEYLLLLDYQDLFLAGIGNYFRYTADVAGLQPYWFHIKRLAEARLAFIDPYSGLIAGSPEYPVANYFMGPSNGSAVTALAAYAYLKLVPLAEAMDDPDSADVYAQAAANLSRALNDQLWEPTLGVYSLSLNDRTNYSAAGIGWSILSDTANCSQAASMIAKLADLKCGVGYKTQSGDVCDEELQLAPNQLGILLEAILKAHRDLGFKDLRVAKSLLDDFWSQMVSQEQYFSGASWEYLYPDGSPGIGVYTSLAHPWGAAPTYILPEYVLGVAATSPGYETWTLTPLIQGFELHNAGGVVVTPHGYIEVNWEVSNGTVIVTADVPNGTQGMLVLPSEYAAECDRYAAGRPIALAAGQRSRIKVVKSNMEDS